jgi:hypothetical protein
MQALYKNVVLVFLTKREKGELLLGLITVGPLIMPDYVACP